VFILIFYIALNASSKIIIVFIFILYVTFLWLLYMCFVTPAYKIKVTLGFRQIPLFYSTPLKPHGLNAFFENPDMK